MHQNGVADTAGEPGNRNPVADDMVLIILPVALGLGCLTLTGKRFKGVLNLHIGGMNPVGEMEMTVLVAAGAERAFQLRSPLRGEHGTSVFRLHKFPELGCGKGCFHIQLFIRSADGCTAVNMIRMIGEPDPKLAVSPFPCPLSMQGDSRQ